MHHFAALRAAPRPGNELLVGAARQPGSLRELAALAHRKQLNLLRTLKKLREAGIVDFEQGPGRTRVPRIVAQRVTLELDLAGPGSVVKLERRARSA